VVGAIITSTSWYVQMPLFFWLGIVFMAVGAGKIAFSAIVTEKEVPMVHKPAHQYARHIPQPPQAAHHPAPQRHAHQYYRCPCGAPVRASDQFCSHCGRRLR